MAAFLRGVLMDLERYCVVVRDRLAAPSVADEVRDYALDAYGAVERVRREVSALLVDPMLGSPALQPTQYRQYRRWRELVLLVESYPLLFVERYDASDRRLTRLCRRLAGQVGWPLPPPLVAAFSTQYYWTEPRFNVVCAPATEGATLLNLPDLYHELGHILMERREEDLVGDMAGEIDAYVRAEKGRVEMQQRPPHYRPLYDRLLGQWRGVWLAEFVADMVATYIGGPAFGWQHIRLCAGMSHGAYVPGLDETADHPADEARLRGIVAVLDNLGLGDDARRIRDLWARYLHVGGETRPADYEVCYPQALVASLARRVVAGCDALGLRPFAPRAEEGGSIVALVGEAWEIFLEDSPGYEAWERARLGALWLDLDGEDGEGWPRAGMWAAASGGRGCPRR